MKSKSKTKSASSGKVKPAKSKEVSVSIEDGMLVVRLPYKEKGTPSSTGKTMNVASTRGNKPFTVEGEDGEERELIVGVNAYFYPED